jgi:hypothetical protein
VHSIFGARVIALVASLLLSACGDNGGGVVGSYEIDTDAARGALEVEMLADVPPAEREKLLDDLMRSMRADIDLNRDQTFVSYFSADFQGQKRESTTKGTWEQEGNRVHFRVTQENGKKKDKPEVMTARYADGRLSITKENGMTLWLKRK